MDEEWVGDQKVDAHKDDDGAVDGDEMIPAKRTKTGKWTGRCKGRMGMGMKRRMKRRMRMGVRMRMRKRMRMTMRMEMWMEIGTGMRRQK